MVVSSVYMLDVSLCDHIQISLKVQSVSGEGKIQFVPLCALEAYGEGLV
jgi:hypothetical protein